MNKVNCDTHSFQRKGEILMNIQANLFDFAYVPVWFDQLRELAEIALPESWSFIVPAKFSTNTTTPILERYIKTVFHKQALAYILADNTEMEDRVFYIRNEFSCFHTGLYTTRYEAIFMCFERNKRRESMLDWFFKGWADRSSPLLRYVSPLPERPIYEAKSTDHAFHPDWEIRVNIDHILGDEANIERLPDSVKQTWNLPLLMETAVELGRRKAMVCPSIIVPQVYQGEVQFLMPIYLTNPTWPDLALALSPMNGYYYGHTCLTLQMAYFNARLLARPTASWLTNLVEPERSPYD